MSTRVNTIPNEANVSTGSSSLDQTERLKLLKLMEIFIKIDKRLKKKSNEQKVDFRNSDSTS